MSNTSHYGIGGAIGRKVLRKLIQRRKKLCEVCAAFWIDENGTFTDNYSNSINNGGWLVPTDFATQLVAFAEAGMLGIMDSEEHVKLLVDSRNPSRKLMTELLVEIAEREYNLNHVCYHCFDQLANQVYDFMWPLAYVTLESFCCKVAQDAALAEHQKKSARSEARHSSIVREILSDEGSVRDLSLPRSSKRHDMASFGSQDVQQKKMRFAQSHSSRTIMKLAGKKNL
jgi:hypothetical protein